MTQARHWRPRRDARVDRPGTVRHLRFVDDYHHACIEGVVAGFAAEIGGHDLDEFNRVGIARYADLPVAELLARWRELNADYRARMRERGDGVVNTSVGDYPSIFQAYYLAIEYSVHGDDFGRDHGDYPGRDAWRAAFARFALTEQDKPVSLVVGEGVTEVGFEGRTYAVSDRDLAEAGAQRLASGVLPDELVSALRCFA